MRRFSKEYLFRECVLHRHCILVRLYEPIQWDDMAVEEIYMVDMCLNDAEKEQMAQNIANAINSYGTFEIKAFAGQESPYDAKIILFSTDNIVEIEFSKM